MDGALVGAGSLCPSMSITHTNIEHLVVIYIGTGLT